MIKWNSPISEYMCRDDIDRLKKVTQNAKDKSKRRVDNIIKSISNIKVNSSKTYEYKEAIYELPEIIRHIRKYNWLTYELIDSPEQVHKLDKYVPARNTDCCRVCSGKGYFINTTIPKKCIVVHYRPKKSAIGVQT